MANLAVGSIKGAAPVRMRHKVAFGGSGYLESVLSGDVSLLNLHEDFLRLDPNGSNRNVTLPSTGLTKGLHFSITNISSGSATLVIKTGSTTLATLNPGECGVFVYGAAWKLVSQAASGASVIAGAVASTNTWANLQTFTTGIQLPASSLLEQRGSSNSGTGQVLRRVGATSSEGMEERVLDITVSPAAVETALMTLPTNHVVDSVQACCMSALTGGGTTVTWGVGITGDVDAYGTVGNPTDSLVKNGKLNAIGFKGSGAGASIGVFSSTTVALKLIGAATGGTSAGNTALTVGSVRVVVRYRCLVDLTSAP